MIGSYKPEIGISVYIVPEKYMVENAVSGLDYAKWVFRCSEHILRCQLEFTLIKSTLPAVRREKTYHK